ncbi:MAG: mannose-1-phosphate guanylyltransferase [Deltaproteobacteria bacterium]|jgi:mannose-1-phosphate guanylyltransferase|nr:mannose-1-phosphate guanylyltransferase [Deltaproteobacteria bacterium]MBW2552725.1 mannose-1-phosphate guanylyltransferase [Deltaproteobacteria bacterium]MCK5423289.1 mannose-1-phosphate guanylyltransferase [Deltaproteobacteria bacterium]
MIEKFYAVIMAGGRGERFWPLSSKTLPKPFLPLLGRASWPGRQPGLKGKTMIQETVERTKLLVPEERIFIVLSRDHLPIAQQQLPEIPIENFIVEPFGRDTAACIGLASLYIGKKDKNASVVILAADHMIKEGEAFCKTITNSLKFLTSNDYIITIGIKPTRPETGYGYIELGEKLENIGNQLFYRVGRFIEKPTLSIANHFLKSGQYYWNSGMFIWRNTTIQKSLSSYMPQLWSGLMHINQSIGSSEEKVVTEREFSKFKKVSIDYGVLEKSTQVVVVPANFSWDDVGTWTALERVHGLDESDNVIVGKHVGIDTHNCIVFSQNQRIATLGVKDLVIVQAEGKILVCHKEKAPFLKEIVRMMEGEEE